MLFELQNRSQMVNILLKNKTNHRNEIYLFLFISKFPLGTILKLINIFKTSKLYDEELKVTLKQSKTNGCITVNFHTVGAYIIC